MVELMNPKNPSDHKESNEWLEVFEEYITTVTKLAQTTLDIRRGENEETQSDN